MLERYLRARLWAFVLIYNWPHWVWVERRKNKQRLRSRANINDIARPASIETNKDSYRELMHNAAHAYVDFLLLLQFLLVLLFLLLPQQLPLLLHACNICLGGSQAFWYDVDR